MRASRYSLKVTSPSQVKLCGFDSGDIIQSLLAIYPDRRKNARDGRCHQPTVRTNSAPPSFPSSSLINWVLGESFSKKNTLAYRDWRWGPSEQQQCMNGLSLSLPHGTGSRWLLHLVALILVLIDGCIHEGATWSLLYLKGADD